MKRAERQHHVPQSPLRLLVEGHTERELLARCAPSIEVLVAGRRIAEPELVRTIEDPAKVRPLNRYAAARHVERLAAAVKHLQANPHSSHSKSR